MRLSATMIDCHIITTEKYFKLFDGDKKDKGFVLFQDFVNHPLSGHCYVASEAYYHLIGKELGYKPYFIRHEEKPHWFLKNSNGKILDLTSDQFKTPVCYNRGIGKGFLTKNPSKRAQAIIGKVNGRGN